MPLLNDKIKKQQEKGNDNSKVRLRDLVPQSARSSASPGNGSSTDANADTNVGAVACSRRTLMTVTSAKMVLCPTSIVR